MIATSATLIAADKIEGAFGLKLGDVYEPTTSPVPKNDIGIAYEFTPTKPNSAFSTYLVFVTPNSHLIYKIEAVHKQPGNAEACHSFLAQVMAALRLKYEGRFDEKSPQSGRMGQGERSIGLDESSVVNVASSGCQFSITYKDNEMAGRCQQEREQNRVKKLLESLKEVDKTGF
jgi:hypothetical protein